MNNPPSLSGYPWNVLASACVRDMKTGTNNFWVMREKSL
jgi:hypothetical protein